MTEEWRDVVGYEGLYQVSNTGKVYSKYRDLLLKQNDNGRGYMTVELCKKGKHSRVYVHRLVSLMFIPQESGKYQVNHIDENKKNNHYSNLQWVTALENMRYGTRQQRTTANTDFSKRQFDYVARNVKVDFSAIARMKWKPVIQYSLSGEVLDEWDSICLIEQTMNFQRQNIIACCKGRRKTAHGYKWAYKEAENCRA